MHTPTPVPHMSRRMHGDCTWMLLEVSLGLLAYNNHATERQNVADRTLTKYQLTSAPHEASAASMSTPQQARLTVTFVDSEVSVWARLCSKVHFVTRGRSMAHRTKRPCCIGSHFLRRFRCCSTDPSEFANSVIYMMCKTFAV
jgi:hypothetical protein